MSDLTNEILIDIRNELRGTNQRLDSTNDRLDRNNDRLDRVVQEQIRHATAIVRVEAGQREMKEALQYAIEGLGSRIDLPVRAPTSGTRKSGLDVIGTRGF